MSIITTKNLIIGGDFSINPWQRGTSFVSVANNTYTADMWRYNKVGSMVHDVLKTTDAPLPSEAGILSQHCLHLDITTAQAILGATDHAEIGYVMEGYDAAYALQSNAELHFWVFSTKPGTYCISFVNSGADRTCIKEYSIGSASTWEYKVIPLPTSPSAGSWNYTNGVGLVIYWSQGAGTNFQGSTADTWLVGNFRGTANQINACDDIANEFKVALVDIKAACHIGSFAIESRENVLSQCQRYYERSYNVGTATGAVTTIGAEKMVVGTGDTDIKSMTTNFKVSKRATPTVTTYDDAGNSGRIQLIGHASNIVPGSVVPSENNVVVSSPGGNAHTGILYQYVADASL
jgi:hypothetical protein